MKQMIVAFAALSFLVACAPADEGLVNNVSMLAEEMTNMQTDMAALHSSVDELTLKNDAIASENAQYADTISELQTELTYLSNEITILKSSRPSSADKPVTPVVTDNGSVMSEDQAKAPKIVIIEDVQSMKDSLYSYAYELYRQGKHNESIESFQEFLTKLPNDDLADNSQYWIGENYYSMNDWQNALSAFQRVITRYPEGGKVADAMLKVGYTQRQMRENSQATATLNELIQKYPRSGAANLAKQTLERWK